MRGRLRAPISRPRVLFKTENGQRLEPIEEAIVDVDEEFAGIVVDKMSRRKAEMHEMRPSGGGKLRLSFLVPTRGLIGYHGEFLTDTRGSGVMSRLFHGYAPYKGLVDGRSNGVLISTAGGAAVAYALWNLEERGGMFVSPGDAIYPGMIIGVQRQTRDNDRDGGNLGQAAATCRTTCAKRSSCGFASRPDSRRSGMARRCASKCTPTIGAQMDFCDGYVDAEADYLFPEQFDAQVPRLRENPPNDSKLR